jgi:hydrogenase maturation protease
MATPAILIGLGNILMQDEGVGVHAVRAIQKRYEVPACLEIVDGGTFGLDLLPYIEGRERVMFVDAVNFGKEPGFIKVLETQEIPALFGTKGSLHHLGLIDVLAAAQLLDVAPQEICLIGIQPQTIEVGLKLTEVMQDKMELLLTQIIGKLQDWNIPCKILQTSPGNI